jgi:hypothetical protein
MMEIRDTFKSLRKESELFAETELGARILGREHVQDMVELLNGFIKMFKLK